MLQITIARIVSVQFLALLVSIALAGSVRAEPGGDVAATQLRTPGGKHAAGKITAIGKSDPRLCEINLGSADGVQIGDEFAIMDPSGKKAVGLVKVTVVSGNACVAEGNGLKLGYAVMATGRQIPPQRSTASKSDRAAKAADAIIDIYNPMGMVLELRQKEWLITGVVESKQPKGIRRLALVDIQVVKKGQTGNWSRTEFPCDECNRDGLKNTGKTSCSECQGAGFVRGNSARKQLLRKNTVLFSASTIGGLSFPSGEQLELDPFHLVLTDPATARRGHRLLTAKKEQEQARKAIRQDALAQVAREGVPSSTYSSAGAALTRQQREAEAYLSVYRDIYAQRANDDVLARAWERGVHYVEQNPEKVAAGWNWYRDRVRAMPSSSRGGGHFEKRTHVCEACRGSGRSSYYKNECVTCKGARFVTEDVWVQNPQ